jgi:membrane protease subunit HflK
MKKHSLRTDGRAVEALLILFKQLTAHARWVFVALLAFYAASGIRTIQPQEQALVLRFGQLQPRVHGPGLLIGLSAPFDQVLRFETGKDHSLALDRWMPGGAKIDDPDQFKMPSEAELERQLKLPGNGGGAGASPVRSPGGTLDPVRSGYTISADTNLVQGRFTLRYRIEEPFRFASAGDRIDDLLGRLTYRALTRQIAGRKIDALLTSDRQELAANAVADLQADASQLGLGVRISGLEIAELSPPSQVLAAFEDVVNARQFAKTLFENSRQYRGETIARSEGEAASILHRAEGFAATLKAEAEGEAASFTALLETHRRSPDLVSRRLLRETLDTVMGQIHSRTFLPADRVQPALMLEPSPEFGR